MNIVLSLWLRPRHVHILTQRSTVGKVSIVRLTADFRTNPAFRHRRINPACVLGNARTAPDGAKVYRSTTPKPRILRSPRQTKAERQRSTSSTKSRESLQLPQRRR